MRTVEISEARHDDAQTVVEMGRAFFESSGLGNLGEFDPSAAQAFFAEAVQSESKAIFIARCCGVPVGMAGVVLMPLYFSPTIKMAQEIFWYAHPEFRAKGVGAKLLKAIEDWAGKQGAQFVCMVALGENSSVRTLYYECGYDVLETSYAKKVRAK